MLPVLLTGANGFIGCHILALLLDQGHAVVAAVRSQKKAQQVRACFPKATAERIDFVIIADALDPHSVGLAVQHDPPFGAVIHCASPVVYNVDDIDTQIVRPAIEGTRTLLESIRQHAPSVKRFIMTSSFAAIEDPLKGARPDHVYSELDWNPLTRKQASENGVFGYMYSKKVSEKLVWDAHSEASTFTVTALNPPLVLGPISQPSNTKSGVNLSNETICRLLCGHFRNELPPTQPFYWVDVRDLAAAHVQALSIPETAGQRFIIAAGEYSYKDICRIVRQHFPGYGDRLPPQDALGGGLPTGGVAKLDLRRTQETFDINWHTLESSVIDLVRSLEAFGVVCATADSQDGALLPDKLVTVP